jgi:hypothetical protein
MEMRPICEKCEKPLAHIGIAFVCSYECTFCTECTAEMHGICPNCKGELVRRPRRVKKEPSAA